MFLLRIAFLFLLVIRFFTSGLEAQSEIYKEISCDGRYEFDSTLFFCQLKEDDFPEMDTEIGTQLFGPYFDHFPQICSDINSALTYFPELERVKIRFSYKPIRQTMNSRPSPLNIFRSKDRWHYTIIVNNNKGRHKGLSFENLSYTIKVGWVGHELSHIIEYQQLNRIQTIAFALKYVFSKSFVRNVERYTDFLAIEHGLAFPLYNGTEFLLNCNDIDTKYRNYAIVNGLSLSEIKCLWSKYYYKRMFISLGKQEKGDQ
jgi:hypothetical protein